ncbi:MAG TPA: MMPL family transporter [Myxococcota bacterium]|nr:MMPL family transporter [Myxococcota bacterium]
MSWAERFSRFFARQRNAFALVIALISGFFLFQMRHLEIYTQFLDLLPRNHPFIHTYETYREVYGNANTVVAAIVVRDGDIYRPEILRAIQKLTSELDSSVVPAEVNAHPASYYVTPKGIVASAVHALVTFADRLFHPSTAVEADTGVDHNLVTSLTDRTARDARVQLDGTLISPQMVEQIPEDEAGLNALREKVRRNPSVFGVLVSLDEKAALVRASFVETRLDYGALFKHLQQAKRDVEKEFPVEVYVTGQPLLFGWAYAFATEILLVFASTLAVSVLLLWAYFRRFYGVFLPMSGAAVNVIWGLGFAAWFGFNLDPLVLVVPMLITARAISHSVQFVERFYEEYEILGDKNEACIRSMAELLLPGTLAILTDVFGLLTIGLATIPLMSKLGLLCAFWATSILVTEMLLNRLLILYLPAPRERLHRISPLTARVLARAAKIVVSPAGATAVVSLFAIQTGVCFWLALEVPVGDNRPGTPILYPNSEFNVAAREIANRFYGLDDLLVIAHSNALGRVYAPDSFKFIESLQRAMETDENAGGSLSLVDLQKSTSRLFHNGDPRWAMWMQTTSEIAGISYLMETSVPAPGILDPYRSRDSASLAVRIFYRDHRADTVSAAIARLEEFTREVRLDGSLAVRLVPGQRAWWRRQRWVDALLGPPRPTLEVSEASGPGAARKPVDIPAGLTHYETPDGFGLDVRHPSLRAPYELWIKTPGQDYALQPSGTWLKDGVELRWAAGSIGVLAAANQEIEVSHGLSLAIVFAATFGVLLLSYRSLILSLITLASLASGSLAALAMQSVLNIGIDVNTLPVQAIGVGLGVDYAIYLVDRIIQERTRMPTRDAAIQHAIRTTGMAITFTASTLVVGIAFWIPISSLRFSAEMSLLLSVLMVVDALGAILLVPAIMHLLPARLLGRLA